MVSDVNDAPELGDGQPNDLEAGTAYQASEDGAYDSENPVDPTSVDGVLVGDLLKTEVDNSDVDLWSDVDDDDSAVDDTNDYATRGIAVHEVVTQAADSTWNWQDFDAVGSDAGTGYENYATTYGKWEFALNTGGRGRRADLWPMADHRGMEA